MTNAYMADVLHVSDFLRMNEIKLKNEKIEEKFKECLFIKFSSDFDFEKNIYQQMKDSRIVIIDEYQGNDYFILGFRQTIIYIEQNSIYLLHSLFSYNDNLKICFLSNSKKSFDKYIQIKYDEIINDRIFEDEIKSFIYQILFRQPKDLFKRIISCIAGYLIKSSYIKNSEDRLLRFIKNGQTVIQEKNYSEKEFTHSEDINSNFSEDEFVFLRMIGNTFSSLIRLFYYIEKEELVVIKTPTSGSEYLIEREIDNYRNMNHPFIPRYYGTMKGERFKSFIMEFIDGPLFQDILQKKMNDDEKLIIIFDLLCIFGYLKSKKYIYRDFKLNNILLDKNNQIVLIDLNSMISIEGRNEMDMPEFSQNFFTKYTAPEIIDINNGIPSYKSDIFSLGKIISLFLDPNKTDDKTQNNELKEMFLNDIELSKCTETNPKDRPEIEDLIKQLLNALPKNPQLSQLLISKIQSYKNYYLSFFSEQNYAGELCNIGKYYMNKHNHTDYKIAIRYFSFAADLNIPEAQFYLGAIYYSDQYIQRDINTSIHYYLLAANQNFSDAQFYLGKIYLTGEHIKKNINKAIKYFTLAANQNHLLAQFILGKIYFSNEYVAPDIDKAIHFFSLAADQNYLQALFDLGVIYSSNEYNQRDINKSIHYLSLAANLNFSDAQFYLGMIYITGEHIKKNINKAIKYLTLAANQNHLQAQFCLGEIYYINECVAPDIDKAINYFTLAAKQNHPQALFNLSEIYYSGVYIQRDINKSIHYLSLAANQNHPKALYNLGAFFYYGDFIPQDINKAIYYFSLAANQNNLQAQFILGEIYFSNEYVDRDINKAIHYYSLAAKQNHPRALFLLGLIYYFGINIQRDMNKGFYYIYLAAKQNDLDAQYSLGEIYYFGECVERDIYKAIHFFTLASNHNHPYAQLNLGLIYINDEHVKSDISKSIYLIQLAANQNLPEAQFILGSFYYNGEYLSNDINKAIYYLSLAANNNHPQAQYELGIIYFMKSDMNKCIHYLIRSSLNGNKEACFAVGYLYHEGKYLKRDINQCIHFYKEASSFDNQYAKNNLGIIYKKGFEDKIKPNLGLSIEYFKEAIKQKNDEVSMYNLGHIYLYENPIEDSINQSIDLLIRSLNKGFFPSFELLCISLIKKYDIDIDSIEQKLDEQSKDFNEYKTMIYAIIRIFILDKSLYEKKYLEYKNIDFLFDVLCDVIQSDKFMKEKETDHKKNPNIKEISSLFFEGFGIN